MAKMPQYAIWDDHDYGPNDAGKSYLLKEASREVFKNYSLNPTYGEAGEGIYTKVSFGDADFFLTDDRYFRADDKLPDSINGMPNPEKEFFGAKQMSWLKNALLFSRATFKFIVTGSQALNPLNKYECLRDYPVDYHGLMDFLSAQKINGVLFLTGDRHHSEVIRIERPSLYPLFDITVSPLTAGVSKASGIEANNPYRELNTLVEAHNFARLSISGKKNERVLMVAYFGTHGEKLGEWSVRETELRAAK
jgi:alkaline phosphatase D